jgi:hypothetical protein
VSSVQSIAVILCCARADAVHVRPLAEHLRNEGIKVRLLEGIDEDAHLLGASLDLELGACMFVACLSDSLGAKAFRRLTGIYSARKGPQHYLADIMVEPDELPAMIESLSVALVRASKVVASGERDKRANSRGPTRLRDVVGVTGISAVGSPPAAPARTRKPKPKAHERAPLREQSVAGSYVISARTGVGEGVARDPAKAEQPLVVPKPSPAAASASNSRMPVVLFLILVAVAGTVALVLAQNGDSQASDRRLPKPAVISAPSNPPPAPDAEAAVPAQPQPAQPQPAQPQPTQPQLAQPEPGVDEAAVIRESIAAGELRAIDLILIANPDARASWREAANLCRAKSHRGVRGWRLPSLEELKILRNARMLDPDRYWSGTLAPSVGDGTDHVFVLDIEARTLDPMSKDTADVRVLCVRAALP